MGAIFLAQWFCPRGQCYHQKVFKTITRLPLTRLQGNKPHRNSPEPSKPCLRHLHQRTPELSGTLQNLPELASATYTNTHRNSPEPSGTPEPSTPELSGTFQNLPIHQHTPQLSGTFRNLPPEPTPAHTGTLRNPPEPSGTSAYTSTHQNSLEPSGTCRRNLDQHTHWNSPEPSGTYTSTHRNFWEPSGICLRNLHQHTPELSGTFRNLPPEPAPATRTGTHRSLSGLKTPLAYAVGEKMKPTNPNADTYVEEQRQYIHICHMLQPSHLWDTPT